MGIFASTDKKHGNWKFLSNNSIFRGKYTSAYYDSTKDKGKTLMRILKTSPWVILLFLFIWGSLCVKPISVQMNLRSSNDIDLTAQTSYSGYYDDYTISYPALSFGSGILNYSTELIPEGYQLIQDNDNSITYLYPLHESAFIEGYDDLIDSSDVTITQELVMGFTEQQLELLFTEDDSPSASQHISFGGSGALSNETSNIIMGSLIVPSDDEFHISVCSFTDLTSSGLGVDPYCGFTLDGGNVEFYSYNSEYSLLSNGIYTSGWFTDREIEFAVRWEPGVLSDNINMFFSCPSRGIFLYYEYVSTLRQDTLNGINDVNSYPQTFSIERTESGSEDLVIRGLSMAPASGSDVLDYDSVDNYETEWSDRTEWAGPIIESPINREINNTCVTGKSGYQYGASTNYDMTIYFDNETDQDYDLNDAEDDDSTGFWLAGGWANDEIDYIEVWGNYPEERSSVYSSALGYSVYGYQFTANYTRTCSSAQKYIDFSNVTYSDIDNYLIFSSPDPSCTLSIEYFSFSITPQNMTCILEHPGLNFRYTTPIIAGVYDSVEMEVSTWQFYDENSVSNDGTILTLNETSDEIKLVRSVGAITILSVNIFQIVLILSNPFVFCIIISLAVVVYLRKKR